MAAFSCELENRDPVNRKRGQLGNEPHSGASCENKSVNYERSDSEVENSAHHQIVSVCLSLAGWCLNHERIGETKKAVDGHHDKEWNEKEKADPVRVNDGFRVHDV